MEKARQDDAGAIVQAPGTALGNADIDTTRAVRTQQMMANAYTRTEASRGIESVRKHAHKAASGSNTFLARCFLKAGKVYYRRYFRHQKRFNILFIVLSYACCFTHYTHRGARPDGCEEKSNGKEEDNRKGCKKTDYQI
jgi:hypothetical protein